MSNAAVINATATLGRVVGSPITIVTDGTVTPKAYGKGSGAWSATLAFAPVVNGVTGSPVTLTISNNQPANVAQSILTDATSWVGWVVSSVGEFEATGIVEGVTGDDSLSGFLGIYKDGASSPKYAIETGSTAMVAGVQMSYNGTGWVTVARNTLPTYDTWAEAVTAAGSTQGWIGRVKTLCGTDYFTAIHNGIRLSVLGGSAIIRDMGPGGVGYTLTATGTAYVALASYTIPAGMIGDGDQFGCVVFGANTGILYSGNDSFSVRVGTNQINAQSQVAFANRRSTSTGSLVRIGAQAVCVSAGPNALSGSDNNNYPGGLISVDFSAAQTIAVGATPGAVGNTMKIEQWSFRRIA